MTPKPSFGTRTESLGPPDDRLATPRKTLRSGDEGFGTSEETLLTSEVVSHEYTELPLSYLPSCSGNVYDALHRGTIVSPRERSDKYVIPDLEVTLEVRASIIAVVLGQLDVAWDHAMAAGYVLCLDPISEDTIYVWQPALAQTGWASFAVRPSGRPLIVQVPHPVFDTHTLEQGLGLFETLSARAIVVAGAHRCANRRPSACDGRTSVCGRGLEPYRESDMAHTVDSVFHATHRALSELFEEDWVVSLHGMSGRGISVSDGTALATRADAPVARFAEALIRKFPEIPVRSCNPFDGRRDGGAHLCGTRNVQGRHLNGLVDAECVGTATVASDRFLHLEQSLRVRRSWREVAVAFDEVLPHGHGAGWLTRGLWGSSRGPMDRSGGPTQAGGGAGVSGSAR